MLWRANLYIDEGGADWNNIYPWNAPATSVDANVFGSFKSEEEGIRLKKVKSTDQTSYSELFTEDNSNKIWYGENEWNRYYDGSYRLSTTKNEPTETEYLPYIDTINTRLDLTKKSDGKQVVKLNSFTYNPKITKGNESKVVAYSYGCSDSPFDFNDEMRQQQLLMSSYYNKDKIKFNYSKILWKDLSFEGILGLARYKFFVKAYELANEDYPSNIISFDNYTNTKTTTINDKWTDDSCTYIKPSDMWSNVSDVTNYLPYNKDTGNYDPPSVPNSAAPDHGIAGTNPHTIPVNPTSSIENFPYLPGWSLWYHLMHKNDVGYDSHPDWTNAISAGVDCIGFASRAASYTSNPYKWGDSNSQDVTNRNDWYINTFYPYYKVVDGKAITSVKIIDQSEGIFDALLNEWFFTGLNKIKPGDLMYLEDTNSRGWHIAIVLSVDVNVDMKLTDIKLIESTWDEPNFTWAKVINTYSINNYKDNKWVVVRPIQQ